MPNTLREVRWPFLVLVAGLFVLSLLAPRQWRLGVREVSTKASPGKDGRPEGSRRGFDTLARDWLARRNVERPKAELTAAAERHADVVAPAESPSLPAVTALAEAPSAGVATKEPEDSGVTSAADASVSAIASAPSLGIVPSGNRFESQSAAANEDEFVSDNVAENSDEPRVDVPHPVPHDGGHSAGDAAEQATAWPMPARTIERLQALTYLEPTRTWAGEMLCVLDDLRRGVAMTPDEFAATLGQMQRLLAAGERLEAQQAANVAVSSEVTRVRLAIERRLDAWRAVFALNQVVRGERFAARENGDEVTVRDPKSVLRILPSSQAILADEAIALLDDIESYEESPTSHTARKIALAARKLTAHHDASARKFGEHVDLNYRNANVRVAAHSDLLNRFLPQPAETMSDIDDYVAGVPVQGSQRTRTRLFVRLLPDERRIRFGLEAHGEVDSDTSTQSGPATVFTTGETRFLARKLVLFDENRWRLFPAVAAARNESSLAGMRTDFDPFPIINSLVHSVVRSKHEERRHGAEREVEDRVSQQAQSQLDSEADPRFAELTGKATEKLVEPLRRLALEPTPIALATTNERVIFRYRLAGADQLGGHTPRPRAPADSWLSVQVHESSINNALANLDLAGRTFELRSLYESVAMRLGRPDIKVPEDVPEDVQVTFATENPLQVRFVDNAAHVTLRLARLEADRQTWRDLTVVAVYEPEANGLDAIFARNSAIRLSGRQLTTRSSIVLRGVFSKMFTRNQQVHLLPERTVSDKRLEGLAVNQLVVHDGWVGLAIGPRRLAGRVVESSSGDSESAVRGGSERH